MSTFLLVMLLATPPHTVRGEYPMVPVEVSNPTGDVVVLWLGRASDATDWALDPGGSVVLAWTRDLQDGSDDGLYPALTIVCRRRLHDRPAAAADLRNGLLH